MFKGKLYPKPKVSMHYLKIINTLLKNDKASLTKTVSKLKNYINFNRPNAS